MLEMKKRLAELGLASNEIDAYLYLLKAGSGKPSFIAKEIGILRSNIYGVLDRLQDYGLIEELGGFKSKVYAAGSIEESLDRLIKREKDKVEKKIHLASKLTGLLEELQSGSRKDNAVDVFKDGAHSASAIKHLFDIAKDEILTISHPPYFSSRFHTNPENEEQTDEETDGYITDEPLRQGFKMYRIYQISDISLASFRLLLRTTLPKGDKIRVTLNAPAKLVIVDRKFVAMGLTSPETGLPVRDTIVVHNPGMARMLADSFFELFNTLPEVVSVEDAENIYSQIRGEATSIVDPVHKGE